MGYLVIGNTTALLHFAFLGYVVFGGFLAWKHPKAIRVHLAVAAYALGIVIIDWPCALTELENWARAMGGSPVMENGFIDHYLTGTLYPREHLLTSRIVMGAVVVASWAGAVVLRRRARGTTAAGEAGTAPAAEAGPERPLEGVSA
ncbi:DUF2784 domain-containing protein [Nocardiopsis suaedae]|uniref:DUF2784 domain-containing protein n=1 Tax=Nocardiopsis suaedae TaxID=3018444 RepID=A0ABT4THG2_9ACTN|nr:DUF2784 domain-containing protein [Nocardiopsis suaedae]MDA2804144.1 DUF2784 domain-containing protein [Nocardiopsis suaedae]